MPFRAASSHNRRVKILVPALLALVLAPGTAWAQGPAAGKVTGVNGEAVATGPARAAQVALKPANDIFLRDRIQTSEHSLLRMLLASKAVVTVRELSVVTITEDIKQIDLTSGKIAYGVVPQRTQAQAYDIRTPNVVASIRGTLVVVEVPTQPAGGPSQTDLHNVSDPAKEPASLVEVRSRSGSGSPVTLGPLQSLTVVGNLFGQIRVLTRAQALRISDLKPKGQAPPSQPRGGPRGAQASSDLDAARGGAPGGLNTPTTVRTPGLNPGNQIVGGGYR